MTRAEIAALKRRELGRTDTQTEMCRARHRRWRQCFWTWPWGHAWGLRTSNAGGFECDPHVVCVACDKTHN